MSGPTVLEKELLTQFRNRLTDVELSGEKGEDMFLLRFIRARENDLDKAEDMLKKHLEWRKEVDADNFATYKPPEDLRKFIDFHHLGFDSENRPIVFFPIGRWKLREVVEAGLAKEAVKYVFAQLEIALQSAKGKVTSTGQPVTQLVILDDIKGLSFRTLTNMKVVDIFMSCARNLEANYPEYIATINILNAGRAFSYVFNLARPILSERTVEKFNFIAGSAEKVKAAVLKAIPENVLPVEYGGTNTLAVASAAEVVEEDEADVPAPEIAGEATLLMISVPAGDKVRVMFTLEEGETVSWKFQTDRYDISFGIVVSGKAYIENKRVNSHQELQEGKANQPGNYIITFDNSYSRLRTKLLSYSVEVKGPSGAKQLTAE